MTMTEQESNVSFAVRGQAIELAAGYLGTVANGLELTRLAGDASSRAYFRAYRLAGATEQRNGPSVIIAVYPEPFDENETAADRLARSEALDPALRLTFANDPCAHIEVTALLQSAGLPVPRILAVEGSAGVMLIEEAGDCRLQEWLSGSAPGESLRAYQKAVELIVRIQGLTPFVLDSNSICSKLAFDEVKLRWELDFFFENYFERHLRLGLKHEIVSSVGLEFAELCRELSALPRVLVHRDFHARNLMIRRGDILIIDHQDARMGPESYDLISLIADPYAGIGEDLRSDLVGYFIELKSQSGLRLCDAGEFRRGIELMTIQRMLKVVGTYSSQAALKDNKVYLPYIKPAVGSALSSMRKLGRFGDLRGLLENTIQ